MVFAVSDTASHTTRSLVDGNETAFAQGEHLSYPSGSSSQRNMQVNTSSAQEKDLNEMSAVLETQPLRQDLAPGVYGDKDFNELPTAFEPPSRTVFLHLLPSFSWAWFSKFFRTTRHPFSSTHEPPDWLTICIHVFLCFLALPVTKGFTTLAQERGLSCVRAIVAVNTFLVSSAISASIHALGQPLLEATAWTTVIRQSQTPTDTPAGMKLRHIVTTIESSRGILAACRIFRTRLVYKGAVRGRRYDPGSIYIVFYLLVFLAATSINFLLGRIVDIKAQSIPQYITYSEVKIRGRVSSRDSDLANLATDLYYLSLPSRVDPSIELYFNGTTVHFVDNLPSLLTPQANCKSLEQQLQGQRLAPSPDWQVKNVLDANSQQSGHIRLSTWGTRIHCLKEDNPDHIMPDRNHVTVVSNTTLSALFGHFDAPFPKIWSEYLSQDQGNARGLISGVSESSGAFSLRSDSNVIGERLFTLHFLLVALRPSLSVSGSFLKQKAGVGYDAATCLEVYEPWVVEAQNSTSGFPTFTRILNPGINLFNSSDEKLEGHLLNETRTLSSTSEVVDIFFLAADSASQKLVKMNSGYEPEAIYLISKNPPNVTIADRKYMGLSTPLLEEYLANTISGNTLPYLSGCDTLLARSYNDEVIARATPKWRSLYAFLAVIALIGVLAGLFIPTLPLGLPHRKFGVYSWIAAFHGGELEGDVGGIAVKRGMHIREVEDTLGDVRFRYVV